MGSTGRVRQHLAVPLFRNAYALVATTGLTAGLGLVYWGLAAHSYRPTEVGRAYAAIALLMLLAGITQLNLVNVLPRFLPRAGTGTTRMVLSAYGASALAAVVVVGIFVSFGGADEVLAVGRSPWGLRAVFVGAVVGWNLFTLQDSVLAGVRAAVWVPLENAVFAATKIVLLVLLAGSLPRIGAFVSWTIPAALAIVPVNVLLFRRILPRHVAASSAQQSLPTGAELTRYVAGDYVGGLFLLSSMTVLPLLVAQISGFRANAFFSTAWLVVGAFDLMLANIGVSFTVEGVIDEERLPHLARSVARLSAAIALPTALVLVVGAPFVLSLLSSEYRAGGVGVLRLVAVAMPFRAVTVLFLSLARVRREIGRLVAVQALSCVLVLGSAALLLPGHGIVGAAAGYLGAQVLVALVVAAPVLRTLRGEADHGPGHHDGPFVPVLPTELASPDRVAG